MEHTPQPPPGSTPAQDPVPILTDHDADGRLRFAVAVGGSAGLLASPGDLAAHLRTDGPEPSPSRAWALAA